MEGVSRGEQRFAVNLTASLITEQGTASVRLLDLSVGGALAEARIVPPPGSLVKLSFDRLEVAARVVWQRGVRFGLAFDRRIRATELFFQLSRSREAADEPPAVPRPRAAA